MRSTGNDYDVVRGACGPCRCGGSLDDVVDFSQLTTGVLGQTRADESSQSTILLVALSRAGGGGSPREVPAVTARHRYIGPADAQIRFVLPDHLPDLNRLASRELLAILRELTNIGIGESPDALDVDAEE
jgi:hypothetical protein